MTVQERGADLPPENRPGVPMEKSPPQPLAHGEHSLPPVSSSLLPPRGLSGLFRRKAYRVPGHKPAHWMLLLIADRIDVMEFRLRRLLPWLLVPAAMLFALRMARR